MTRKLIAFLFAMAIVSVVPLTTACNENEITHMEETKTIEKSEPKEVIE
jgi:hypothetical protein